MANTMINLLKSRDDTSMLVTQHATQVRIVGFVLLAITLITALLTGSLYAYVYSQKQSLESRKEKVQRELIAQKSKESRFLLLKSRAIVVEKVLAGTKHWEKPLQQAISLSAPPKLTSISSTDQGSMIWSYKLDSIEECLDVISGLFTLLSEKKIRKPILADFSIDKANSVKFSLEITPVFE